MEAWNPTTRLLVRLREGDGAAEGELVDLVYGELRTIAERQMRGQAPDHTLQPTALVSEAYVRLVAGEEQKRWESRAHFLGAAARAMRSALIDHARAKKAAKRGGGYARQPLDAVIAGFEEDGPDLLALDNALQKLKAMDGEAHELVELRYFGGLTFEEAARVLGTSERTCRRSWSTARAWLRRELAGDE